MPKEAISSVVGLGGFVGYLTSGVVNGLTGLILQKTGSYVLVFMFFSGSYVASLIVIQLMIPVIGQQKLSARSGDASFIKAVEDEALVAGPAAR
jgi:ACS family hexuronate transporter-like MFS transporter